MSPLSQCVLVVLSSNSGSVKKWKYVFIVLIYLVTLEVWKCGNMSSLSLSNNSGGVEMWKCGNVEICLHCLNLSNNSGSVEMWKCGNVEICLPCLCLITLEVWKCGNVEMWKYVFLNCLCLITLEVWKCGNVEICLHCLNLSNNSGSNASHFAARQSYF